MTWFCKHKWKTLNKVTNNVYSDISDGTDLPIRRYLVIEQQCKNCGKEVVRRFLA